MSHDIICTFVTNDVGTKDENLNKKSRWPAWNVRTFKRGFSDKFKQYESQFSCDI